MNNQTRPQTKTPTGSQADINKKADDVLSNASSLAEQAAGKVTQVASEATASITGEVKNLLDRQVSGGSATLGLIARSAKRAADELDRDAPQVAGLVRTFATQIGSAAEGLKDQSIDQMWQTAADFTRRQPAVVFGLAALAGFFALRLVKSSRPITAPSIQPSQDNHAGRIGGYYGT